MFKKKVMRKVKFRKKLKLWRLRESEVKEEFPEEVNNKCGDNEDWCGLKRKLLDAEWSLWYTKDKPRQFETWWWNKDVDVAVCRESFRIWKQSRNEEDRKKYCEAKKYVKTVVYMAMDQKTRQAVKKVDSRVKLFRTTKQGVGEKKDVVGIKCLSDESGAMKVWMIE